MSAPACPICGKPTDPATRPFCSKRCSDVDLHRWLAGSYAIPASDEEGEQDAPPGAANEDDDEA
jgi:uncharacterized protein